MSLMESFKSIDRDPLAFLVAPMNLRDFKNTIWEQQFCLRRATPERAATFSKLFDLQTLLTVAEQRQQANNPLEFGPDITAARYAHGKRTTPVGQDTNVAELKAMYNKHGCTFQVHQPQRFGVAGECDGLWRLVSALESQLGCLVGCNAYITPPKTQGLAPHHDDVEIFICQTQGAKRWKLYEPLGGYSLPNQSSPNLSVEALGEPVLDTTLRVGDVLYMPRGTLHQAVASSDGSSHITLSTYHNWASGDFAMRMLQIAGAGQHEAAPVGAIWPLAMRRSLPWGYLHGTSGLVQPPESSEPSPSTNPETPCLPFQQHSHKPGGGKHCGPVGSSKHRAEAGGSSKHGTEASNLSRSAKQAAAAVAAGLRAFADQLEAKPDALVNQAANAAFTHFICRRLPPHPEQLHPKGPAPTLKDALVCRGRNLFKVMPVPDQPEDCCITTPVHNNRLAHMCGPSHIVIVNELDQDDEVQEGQEQDKSTNSGGDRHSSLDSSSDDESQSDGEDEERDGEEVLVVGPDGQQRALKAVAHREGSIGGGAEPKAGSLSAQGQGEARPGENSCEHSGSLSAEDEEDSEGQQGGEQEGQQQQGLQAEVQAGVGKGGLQDGLQQFESVLPGPVAPTELAAVIEEVLNCHQPPGVCVRDIAKKPHVRGKEEALEIAMLLWREGFVYTVPASSSQQPQQLIQQQPPKNRHAGGILKGVQHNKQGRGHGKKKQRGGKALKRKASLDVQPSYKQKQQKQ